MDEVIRYASIDQKKKETKIESLSDQDALVRTLDLLDFYAALRNSNKDLAIEASEIHWIELKETDDFQ
jgi:hypothetical protein